jgi:hypothetical protein
MISRRTLVLGGGALWVARSVAQVEEGAPVVLELPPLTFDPGVPVFAAVNTSGHTDCQVQILGGTGQPVLQSRRWGTEPNVSNAAQLSGEVRGRTPQQLKVRISMHPTARKTPSAAMAMRQGTAVDLEELKRLARQARFVKDPARLPGGQFEVILRADSSLTLEIWPNEGHGGKPVYKHTFANLPGGTEPIPIGWNLRENNGAVVPAGRYFAALIARPIAGSLHPTYMSSYFAVIT